MPISCPECTEPIPQTAVCCPGCGLTVERADRVRGTVGSLPARLVGVFAYFVLPAGLFLTIEPYKSNRFARFHSFQSLAGFLAASVVSALLWLVGGVLGVIPVLALLFLSMLIGLAFLVIWIVLVVKAFQGEIWKLPVMGDMAEKLANSVD